MVEILDPMVLGSRVCLAQGGEPCQLTIPGAVQAVFEEELVLSGGSIIRVADGQSATIRRDGAMASGETSYLAQVPQDQLQFL